MSNTSANVSFLKNSARYPKVEVTAITVPTVQVSKEEWNKAVEVLQQVQANESTCNGLTESFSSEILGELPLADAVTYDDQVEYETEKGRKVTLTSVAESTGWAHYGIRLPSSLVNGRTYTIKGKVTNNAQGAVSIGNYSTLYPEGETQNFWLVYELGSGDSADLNYTFTYSASHPYLAMSKSVLHYVGDSVTLELYIKNEDARMLVAEQDIVDLQDRATADEEDIDELADAQEDMYTDVYGAKRLLDGRAYDSAATVTVEGNKVTITSNTAATGWPAYGVKLPSTLVNGQKYTIKGTIKNNTAHVVSVGNFSSLYPSNETPNFWLVYELAAGQTATVEQSFTYYSTHQYIAIIKTELQYAGDSVEMTINVNEGENILGRLEALEGEEGSSCVITSAMPSVKATDGTLLALLNEGDNTGWAFTQESNGMRMVASGASTNYTVEEIPLYPEYNAAFNPGKTYGIFTDIESTAIALLNEQDVLELTFSFVKGDYTQNSATMRIKQGEMVAEGAVRKLQQVSFISTGTSDSEFTYVRLKITKYNTTGATSTITDILIKRLIIFEVPTAYSDYTELDFVALLKNAGTFTSLAVVAAAKMRHANLLYDGLTLKSLGDSLPETLSFQPLIAQALGMEYDAASEIADDGTYKRSAMGSTRVVPTVWSSSGAGSSGYSIYMRAKSLVHWSPDVLIVLAGYNDVHAGEAYIAGGTAVEPDDYGINDAAYTGGEVNLLSDPTLSVPSFGASYRGMVTQILTDMPWCRVILCGIPRGSGEVSLIGTDSDWVLKKNAVIEQIAGEFGLPFVDLSKVYGVNALNYEWLTKDGLHFSDFGGRRVAMELLAKVF